MKKFAAALLAISMLSLPAYAADKDNVRVIMDGTEIQYDVPAQIIDDSTMVPVRATFEAMGMEIAWDEKTKTVTAKSDTTELKIKIGEKSITKNKKKYQCDTPAMIINDRTLIPLRAISELSDFNVEWNSDTYTVTLTHKTAEELAASQVTPTATPKVTGDKITITNAPSSMYVGDSITLTAVSGRENDEFQWTSSDKNIITISNDGVATAKYPGKCKITVESKITGEVKNCTIKTGYSNVSVKFHAAEKTLYPGQLYQPNLTVTPEGEKELLTWSTADKAVATVKNGIVTAVAAGETQLIVTTSLGTTAEMTIKVTPGGHAELYTDFTSKGSLPGKNAPQGAPPEIKFENKSDTDIVISPQGILERGDGSVYTITQARFSTTSKIVGEVNSESRIAKGKSKKIKFAIKGDPYAEGFAFKYGDKLTLYVNCGGIDYTCVIDHLGRNTLTPIKNN